MATSWLLAINDDLDLTILTFNIWCTLIVALKVHVDGHNATHDVDWANMISMKHVRPPITLNFEIWFSCLWATLDKKSIEINEGIRCCIDLREINKLS